MPSHPPTHNASRLALVPSSPSAVIPTSSSLLATSNQQRTHRNREPASSNEHTSRSIVLRHNRNAPSAGQPYPSHSSRGSVRGNSSRPAWRVVSSSSAEMTWIDPRRQRVAVQAAPVRTSSNGSFSCTATDQPLQPAPHPAPRPLHQALPRSRPAAPPHPHTRPRPRARSDMPLH